MRSYTIEAVARGEIAACAALIRESFSTVAREFGLTRDNCPTHGAFLPDDRLMADFEAGISMFLARAEGQPIGFVALEFKGDQVYLEKLAVLPSARHEGLGRALVEHAAEFARSKGALKMMIGIIEENTRLRDWYAALGFQHTGTKRFPHLPFTVGFMEMDLTAQS